MATLISHARLSKLNTTVIKCGMFSLLICQRNLKVLHHEMTGIIG